MSNRFAVLLCALAFLLFVSPILGMIRHEEASRLSRWLVYGGFNFLLISSLFAVCRSRKVKVTAWGLFLPTLLLFCFGNLLEGAPTRLLSYIFSAWFLGFVVMMIIRYLFRTKLITSDTICASICAYLLMGVFWAILYSITEIIFPGSFSISDVHFGVSEGMDIGGSQSGFSIYYSLETLTTLGYGDVVPVNAVSRALAGSEAVVGAIYLAVLVARLVGLQISQSIRSDQG